MKLVTFNKLFLFLVAFVLVERFCYLQTEGFALSTLICPTKRTINAANHVDLEAQEILKQPFYYLGKGSHFFAFVSEDERYVLKFVKQYRSAPGFWFNPEKLERGVQRVINSCQLAYDSLKSETAIIAVHLQPDPQMPHCVQLIDKLGIAHSCNLNATSYLLQKKATPVNETTLTATEIEDLKQLIKNRLDKGIVNKDVRPRNFGLLDGHPIEIDVGAFASLSTTYDEALKKETDKLL